MRNPLLAAFATLATIAVVSPARAGETGTTTPTTTTSTAPSATEKPAANPHDCSKTGHAANHKCPHGAAVKGSEHMHMGGEPPASSTEKTTAPAAKATSAAPAKPAVTYVCPMHPEVTSDKKGRCPKCNMFLEPKK